MNFSHDFASYPDDFRTAFIHTVGIESGKSNHPKDRGGRTYRGVSSWSYPDLFEDGRWPTDQEVEWVYYDDFWYHLQCSKINSHMIQKELFDTAVNCGTRSAVRWMQWAINRLNRIQKPKVRKGQRTTVLKEDGLAGPMTIGAVNAWCRRRDGKRPARALYALMNYKQCAHYLRYADKYDDDFLEGWLTDRVAPENTEAD